MLYQELPRIESTPLDGWGRWLAPALIAAAAVTAAVVLVLMGHALAAGIAVFAGAVAAGLVFGRSASPEVPIEPLVGGPDYSLVGSTLGLSRDPVALTDGAGSLLVVNTAYRERFGGAPPLQLAADAEARHGLRLAPSVAWRHGAGCGPGI